MGQQNSTPNLHQLVKAGRTKQLRHLLRRGLITNINAMEDEQTALYMAVKFGMRPVIDLLLDHGADPNVVCTIHENWSFPWSVMHETCWHGMTSVLQRLIDCGANLDLEGHQKMSPLHIAAWFGQRDIIKILIDGGCNINHLDRFKESAIVMPVCRGDRESVRQLLMAGCRLNSRSWANIKKIQCSYDREFKDQIYTKHGPFSLLMLAIKYTWLDIAILLLQHGFNPNKYSVMDVIEDIRSNMGIIDDKAKQVIECYLAAGYKFRTNDEQELRDLQQLIESHEDTERRRNQSSQSQSQDSVEGSTGNITVHFNIDNNRDTKSMTNSVEGGGPSTIPIIVFNPDPRIHYMSLSIKKDFLQWLFALQGFKETHSLQQLCRVVIRSHLRVCRQQASVIPPIMQLNIPQQLKDYLVMAEFGDPATERPSTGSTFQKYLDTEKNFFAMPRRVNHQDAHVYVQFWKLSCCCGK